MGPVKSKPLEIVERVLGNMPIFGREYLYRDAELGRIYIGFGKEGVEDIYHGVWAFTEPPQICQPVHFSKGVSRATVIEALFTFGREALNQFGAKKDLWRA
jgi:hypothetical protein